MKNDDIKRRLLQRHDVAEVTDDIVVTNSSGEQGGPFETFSDAIAWLIGPEIHLTGMAACPCLKCGPGYVGPR